MFSAKTQVNMTQNGQTMPSISPDAELIGYRTKNSKSFKQQLKEFLKSEDFQNYCNLKQNGIKEGSMVWIVRGDFFAAMQGTKGDIFSDFTIVPFSCREYLYKAPKFVNKPGIGETQICFSQTYIVRKNGQGQWIAEVVLKDEDWLKQAQVKAAFEEISRLKGYRLAGNVSVFGAEFEGVNTQAWVSVVTVNGKGRLLMCLLDSGRLVDKAVDEVNLKKTDCPSVVKTKFNWFKYWDGNVLIRN